jgi:hypothetical protein
MATRIGLRLGSLSPLVNADMQNGAKARADILTRLAGASALYNQFVSGVAAIAGHENLIVAPHNGLPGHTHSGAGDGTPLQGPLISTCWGYMPNANVSNEDAPGAAVTAAEPVALVLHETMGTIFVPDCPPQGCYYDLEAVVGLIADVNAFATVRIGGYDESSIALVASTPNYKTITGRVMCRPGRLNIIELKIYGTRAAADGSIYALSFSLNQVRSTP